MARNHSKKDFQIHTSLAMLNTVFTNCIYSHHRTSILIKFWLLVF